MLLGRLGCLLGIHHPDRKNVDHDGSAYIAPCKHCGTRLRRRGHRSWSKSRVQ